MNFVAKNFDELTTSELYEILKSRLHIFMLEQNIYCQDMDDVDYISRHYFLEEDGKVLAYLRAFYVDGKDVVKIGRVLSVTHGKGLGRDLMQRALSDIKQNMKCKKVCVNSQKQASGFYGKMGFVTVSGEFLEEGIVHVKMQMEL